MRRILSLGVLAIALTASPAWADLVMKADSFICNGEIGPASVTVRETNAGLELAFKAAGLPPNAEIQCGFFCTSVAVDGTGGHCGSAGADGKWSFTTVLPVQTCFGITPAFLLTDIGTCVPGITAP